MKLKEIIGDQDSPGTYAGVRFDSATIASLKKYIKENNIPNPEEEFHTTLLYSRKHLPNYQPVGEYPQQMTGTPLEFEMFDEDASVLVLTFSCPTLYQRHHKLMLEHGGTYDFDRYIPHITLSYNIDNLNVEGLPSFEDDIVIVEEYHEELNE